jgi:hypothetical protein
MAPLSSAVTAGTDAVASDINNIRTDAITRERVYVFEVFGTLAVGDEQGAKYIVPANSTVTKIKHKIDSGTSATFRIQKNTTDVDSGIVAGTSVATDSSISSASLTADQVLSLDITAISGSPTWLIVQVTTTETI